MSPPPTDATPSRHAAAVSLSCEGIVFRRGTATVLDGIDLHVRDGDCVALLGANGAGKSTLLRILLGVLTPAAGTVRLDGVPLARLRRPEIARHIAYVPQHHVPALPYTVDQMVSLGRLPHGTLLRRPGAADRAAVAEALERMQLSALAQRDYTQLSGGERQRVLLARALAQGARVLLMDEPLTGLDFGHQLQMQALLAALARDGHAIVQSSHRPDDACQLASRVVLLGGARVIADGAPREVLDAATIGALYGERVEQLDIDGSRFFRAAPPPLP